MEGSIVYGLTAALYGEITIENGRVSQGNFDTYRMMRLHEMPQVEVALVPSGGFWGGVGEPGYRHLRRRYVTPSSPRPGGGFGRCH